MSTTASIKVKGDLNEIMNLLNFQNLFKSAAPAIAQAALKNGPALVGLVNGPAGAIAGAVSTAILKAEELHGPTTSPSQGVAKKTTASSMLEVAAPALADLLLAQTGRTVQDGAAFGAALDQILEGFVALYKAVGVLPAALPQPTVILVSKPPAA